MTWLRIVMMLAALTLLGATLLLVRKNKYARYLTAIGFTLCGVVVAANWIYNGYVPFIRMYQVLAFVSVCFPLAYLLIHFVRGAKIEFAYFTLCASICMIGSFAMFNTMIWHRAPALQSVFFIPHILCYMLSYSLCAVAFVQTVIMLFQKKDGEARLETERSIYATVITAFPFMVAGMFLGAIWANECWGNYWSWDPKENWALITTCLYAIYFHVRKHKSFKRAIAPILILAFVSLLITFVGVNAVEDALHSYS